MWYIVEVIYQAETPNTLWLQQLRFVDLLFLSLYQSKMNIFVFWTFSQTKQDI